MNADGSGMIGEGEHSEQSGSCHDRSSRHGIEQVRIAAGQFRMGDAFDEGEPIDGEQPVHDVWLSAFDIDATAVTNRDFACFVAATGYVTDAERSGFSAVFHRLLRADLSDVLGAAPHTPWWLGVRGADWRHPFGLHSRIDELMEHPVVHVSWQDAMAYCDWAGRSLPTEAQWEYAARGGLQSARFPWGDEAPDAGGRWRCNIWQGDFPDRNSGEDGFLATAPVRRFAANGFGLWQMSGNVWQWCRDWFAADYYARGESHDPLGPSRGERRVLRGGSYLCHPSYCDRYRVSARSSNEADASMGNAGFRTVSRDEPR